MNWPLLSFCSENKTSRGLFFQKRDRDNVFQTSGLIWPGGVIVSQQNKGEQYKRLFDLAFSFVTIFDAKNAS